VAAADTGFREKAAVKKGSRSGSGPAAGHRSRIENGETRKANRERLSRTLKRLFEAFYPYILPRWRVPLWLFLRNSIAFSPAKC
jgi:hypothetical protein